MTQTESTTTLCPACRKPVETDAYRCPWCGWMCSWRCLMRRYRIRRMVVFGIGLVLLVTFGAMGFTNWYDPFPRIAEGADDRMTRKHLRLKDDGWQCVNHKKDKILHLRHR